MLDLGKTDNELKDFAIEGSSFFIYRLKKMVIEKYAG